MRPSRSSPLPTHTMIAIIIIVVVEDVVALCLYRYLEE